MTLGVPVPVLGTYTPLYTPEKAHQGEVSRLLPSLWRKPLTYGGGHRA